METILFKSDLIKVGHFRLSPDNPRFNKEGFVENPLIVFPGNSIWIQHKNKEAFVADSSVINLYNRHQVYNRYLIDNKGDDCLWVEPSEYLLEQLIKKGRISFNAENFKCEKTIFVLFRELLASIKYKETTNAEEQAINLLSNIKSAMNSKKEVFPKTDKYRKLVEKVKLSIHSHLNENFSLTDISQEVFSSPYHMCRVFKQVTGMGIHSFKNTIRLNKIYSEIQKGEQDISTLAHKYGYSSHSHLSYNFKKHFNIRPSSLEGR